MAICKLEAAKRSARKLDSLQKIMYE